MSCPICLSKFQNRAEIDCKHAFCRKCIVKWSKSNTTCPMCRADFTEIKTEKSIKRVQPIRKEETWDFASILVEFLCNDNFKMGLASDYLSDSPRPVTMLLCAELWRVLNHQAAVSDLISMGVPIDEINISRDCLLALFRVGPGTTSITI